MGKVKDLLICNIDSIGPGQWLMGYFNREFPQLATDVADGIISAHLLLAANKYRAIVIMATAQLVTGATHIAMKLNRYGYAPSSIFIFHSGPASKDARQTLAREFFKGDEAQLLAAAKEAAGRDPQSRWLTKSEILAGQTEPTGG